MKQFASFLEELKATPDGDSNLLERSMILYGSGMGNGNVHSHDPLPILVAGGGAGQIKGNRNIKVPEHTPLANLMLALVGKAGVEVDRVGNSNGRIEL